MINTSSKNIIFSLITFVSAFISLYYLDTASFSSSSQSASFDNLIQNFTNYKWMWVSSDIAFAIFIAIPLILLLTSVFFAFRAVKSSSTQSKTQRIASVIMASITTGTLVSIVGSNLYLWIII